MKKLTLNLFDRLTLMSVLSQERGDIGKIRILMKVMEEVEVTEAEEEAVSLRKSEAGVQWDVEKEKSKDCIINNDGYNMLVDVLQGKQDWPADKRIVAMIDKVVDAPIYRKEK